MKKRVRQEVTIFVESWIATELLVVARSGENEEQVRARFAEQAAAAGLTPDEIEYQLHREAEYMHKIAEKHQGRGDD